MKRLKYIFITLLVSLFPMLYVLLQQESNYPALKWLSVLLVIAFATGLGAMLLTFYKTDFKDITPKNWDKYEEE